MKSQLRGDGVCPIMKRDENAWGNNEHKEQSTCIAEDELTH